MHDCSATGEAQGHGILAGCLSQRRNYFRWPQCYKVNMPTVMGQRVWQGRNCRRCAGISSGDIGELKPGWARRHPSTKGCSEMFKLESASREGEGGLPEFRRFLRRPKLGRHERTMKYILAPASTYNGQSRKDGGPSSVPRTPS